MTMTEILLLIIVIFLVGPRVLTMVVLAGMVAFATVADMIESRKRR